MIFFRSVVLLAGMLLGSSGCAWAGSDLVVCCREENSFYRILKESGVSCTRSNTPDEAVLHAAPGSGVLVLAEGYPGERTRISDEVLTAAVSRGLRLYLEYPEQLPGIEFGPVTSTKVERVVVNAPAFGEELPPLSILSASGCRYLPTTAPQALLSVARVAGYDRAVFGLPEDARPLLIEVPHWNALVATTSLSRFAEARYGPTAAWARVWTVLLSRLGNSPVPALRWTPPVRPAYGPAEELPDDVERAALGRAAEWIRKSGLLLTQERARKVREVLRTGGEEEALTSSALAALESGDGSYGILEGYASDILHDGMQKQRLPVRADCQAETAMLLAMDAAVNGNEAARKTAARLLDFTYGPEGFCTGARGDKKHAAWGHIAWGLYAPAWEVGNYGDDNARAIVATLAAAALLETDQWDLPVMRAVAANFRTTGRKGFRGDRVDMPQLEQEGWKALAERDLVNLSPHFEAALWACYLLAYEQTGYAPFLEKTRTGIRLMMEGYPSGWRWQDNSERTDMLWSLAWLVRVDDTPEHREWLRRVADDLLATMKPNGAIPERLARSGGGHYQVPQTNESFGTGESPLIQENGDPVSDQLYTTAFALIALREAAAVTGDPDLRDAEDRLARYLCRIQVRSDEHPYLDGAWLRAFDYSKWDYWASSGDIGWGPWCAEAGWGHVWIATTLGLRARETSMWELLTSRDFDEEWERVHTEMLAEAR